VELRLVKTMPKEKHFSEEYFNNVQFIMVILSVKVL